MKSPAEPPDATSPSFESVPDGVNLTPETAQLALAELRAWLVTATGGGSRSIDAIDQAAQTIRDEFAPR
ncbi:MAG: hypothetical protein OXH38_11905 [Chloroflexi bacterium]|nr:hypothetical protein [Chloroflexota bacterium]